MLLNSPRGVKLFIPTMNTNDNKYVSFCTLSLWAAMAQWLERWPFIRRLLVQIPPLPAPSSMAEVPLSKAPNPTLLQGL